MNSDFFYLTKTSSSPKDNNGRIEIQVLYQKVILIINLKEKPIWLKIEIKIKIH